MPRRDSRCRFSRRCLGASLLLLPIALAPGRTAYATAYAEFPAHELVPAGGAWRTSQDAPATQPDLEPRVVVLQFRTGSRVRGTLLAETDQAYRLASPELGMLTIAKDAVLSVLPPDAPLGPPAAPDIEPPPPGLFGTQVLASWTKSVELGFSGTSGAVDTFDVFTKLSGDYEDESARWRVRAAYLYGLTEEDNTKNEGFANARRDWLNVRGPWFFWAEGRADYNEFKDYILRTGGFAGVGYTVSDTEKLKLLGRAGAGASYEFGAVDDLVPEALFSVELRWRTAENQTLELVNTVFPDLSDLGEYRNFTEASYSVRLQRGRGLSMKVGLQNEYDSFTEDDSQHNELSYFGALVFDF